LAATNRDLKQRVKEGTFREDLYYRLNVVSIEMPPLRARSGDIPLLAAHFLRKYTEENGKPIAGFSDDALAGLVRYSWPGNVRELENAVERAVVVCRNDQIRTEDLIPTITSADPARAGDLFPTVPGASMADLERYAILKTLEHVGGSTSKAAELLGISARTIQYRLREYMGEPPSTTGAPPLASGNGDSGDGSD
jgi:DNA-binding NtrC family response regulator